MAYGKRKDKHKHSRETRGMILFLYNEENKEPSEATELT